MTIYNFLAELEQHGYTVVPNIIPKNSCQVFIDSAWNWLESFPYDFRRDDRSTWTEEHLPYEVKGGLYNRYLVNHEGFVWNIGTKPGIIKVFEEIWGMHDLIVSFDGMNACQLIPNIDQNPHIFSQSELYQAIANLSPNGPDDGGLVVLPGFHKLHQQHFDYLGGFRPEKDLGIGENGYDFLPEDAEWYREHGCEEIKICADQGDLILWDSRPIHWNANPTGKRTRLVTYVCYCPRDRMSEKDLGKKLDIFRAMKGTTHWPNINIIPAKRANYARALPRQPDGRVDPANRTRPISEPEENQEVMRLVGVRG
ncbi:hypothetical protein M433DRAFT_549745 [Acidomyces richmondensis BFW]|nr:MAG: hypothetical protein FE78DRAFT_536185 [Acidomyces sp. 'richmondensis']KYG41063.1 hypothetical protein M433DRAFT_549745 [Acidomyces richmondensis BFW]